MSDTREQTTLHVVRILAQASDRWRLTDPYVERVWAEIVGPTATLLARRLGWLIDEHPDGLEVEQADLAKTVGVAPMRCIRGLERLHRCELVAFQAERRIVGVSGYAPSVGGRRLEALGPTSRAMHERLTADAAIDVGAPPAPPARARVSSRRGAAGAGLAL